MDVNIIQFYFEIEYWNPDKCIENGVIAAHTIYEASQLLSMKYSEIDVTALLIKENIDDSPIFELHSYNNKQQLIENNKLN